MTRSPDGQSSWNKRFKILIRLVEMVSFGAEICREVFHDFVSVERKFVIFDGNLCILMIDQASRVGLNQKLSINLSRLEIGFVDFVWRDQEPINSRSMVPCFSDTPPFCSSSVRSYLWRWYFLLLVIMLDRIL